jgi:hypothetical protein
VFAHRDGDIRDRIVRGDHGLSTLECETVEHCHEIALMVDVTARAVTSTTRATATVADVLGGPVQIAYAVDDVVSAAATWVERGIGPFFVRQHIEVVNARLRGRPGVFDHSSAFAQWGEVMIELIHQHDGGIDPIVGSSGIHHVAHFIDDFSAASTMLRDSGRPEVLYGETSTGMPFAFHDGLDERGHLIEIYERTPALARFYDMLRAAATNWDGSDPIRRL